MKKQETDRGAPLAQSKASHTPGPWKTIHDGRAVSAAPKGALAFVDTDLHGPKESAANAKLIAAAPALADELEDFLRSHTNTMDETGSCTCPFCVRFRAVLRAAGRLP